MVEHNRPYDSFSCFIIGETTLIIECAEILLHHHQKILGIATSDACVVKWSTLNEIPIIHTEDKAIVDTLTQQAFDCLICIAPKHIPEKVLSLPKLITINYHDSLLPRYGGRLAPSRAIVNRENKHGVTWYLTDSRSYILNQISINIDSEETAFTLNIKCYDAAIESFRQLMTKLPSSLEVRNYQEIAIEDSSNSIEWPFPGFLLSFEHPAHEIDAFVRALNFGEMNNPIGMPKLLAGIHKFILTEITILDVPSQQPPGMVMRITPNSIVVSTATNDVEINEVLTLEGNRLLIPDFVKISNLKVNSQLPTVSLSIAHSLNQSYAQISKWEDFWVRRLSNLRPIPIPFSFQSKKQNSFGIRERRFPVSDISGMLNISLPQSELILCAFLAYLSRVTRSDTFDVLYSDSTIQRHNAQLDGIFASHVPLFVNVNLEESFLSFCKSVRSELVQTRKRITYTQDILIRYPTLNPPLANPEEQLSICIELVDTLKSFDPNIIGGLTIIIPNSDTKILFQYDGSILSENAINRLLDHFSIFIKGVISDPYLELSNQPLLSQEDQSQLFFKFNDTKGEYPENDTLDDLFKEQVTKTPNNVAVVFEDERLTYHELDELSNGMANELRSQGIAKEDVVGLMVDASIELIIGMIGIIKAGCAFLPIDPMYPKERIEFMLQESDASILLTHGSMNNMIDFDGKVVNLEHKSLFAARHSECKKNHRPSDLAYVIYTSGSTGKPKGVQIEHTSIVNQIYGLEKLYPFDSTLRHILLASITFDPSVQQIFLPLTSGGTLFLVSKSTKNNMSRLADFIASNQIDIINTVPSFMNALLDPISSHGDLRFRYIVLAGETFSRNLYIRLKENLSTEKIINIYGPTEATINTTLYECKSEEIDTTIPIGKPLMNYNVLILDEHQNLLPCGVPGEICISGVGVARGYNNNPELTAEKFIANPFNQGERIYRTGDLGRWTADGNIEFLGRTDHQVKVRGFRVELGEVETALGQHHAVREVVVVHRKEHSGYMGLAAYAVPIKEQSLTASELRRFLKEKLPDYMIPSVFMILEALPLNPNGKVDRRALPEPGQARQELVESFVPPGEEVEKQLTKTWQKVLGIQPIGVKDDFFDLGGSSLLAMVMLAQFEKLTGKYFPLATFLNASTIEKMVSVLSKNQEERSAPWSPLVTIQSGGSKPPIFFVHGADGNILIYRELARRLGSDQPVYGLQSQILNTDQPIFTRIEDMASHFLKEITAVQPQGPYFLGGYCLGGSIAFEIAQQLKAKGQEVALLALMETYNFSKTDISSFFDYFYHYLQKFEFHLRNFLLLKLKEKITFFKEKVEVARRRRDVWSGMITMKASSKFAFGSKQASHLYHLWKINDQAAANYKPKAYPGRIVQFAPRKEYKRYIGPELGWDKLSGEGLEIIRLPVFPAGMLIEPFVRVLAEKLTDCLEEARHRA